MPIDHLCNFFGKMSIQAFCPFFNRLFLFLILSCMSCLYILDINPLSILSFVNIFSHSVGCLFFFFLAVVSFVVQMLLSLIRSHLFIFALISFAIGYRCKKMLLWFMSKSVLPMLSSRSYMVSSLTVRSLIPFQFIFVHGVRKCFNSIFLCVTAQFSQHDYWRDCLSPLYILASFVID